MERTQKRGFLLGEEESDIYTGRIKAILCHIEQNKKILKKLLQQAEKDDGDECLDEVRESLIYLVASNETLDELIRRQAPLEREIPDRLKEIKKDVRELIDEGFSLLDNLQNERIDKELSCKGQG